MDILLLYATRAGQTAKIAEFITQTLRNKNLRVITQSVDRLPAEFNINAFESAIIGGPIHIGHYPKPLLKFIRQNHDWLNQHPSALFTVCLAIKSQRTESRKQAENFGKQLISETNWQPIQMATFAGAVKYTQYGLLTRFIMKQIAKSEGGSTDTSRDHEYTDWDEVRQFTEEFLKHLPVIP